jgi:hypothetical protein
VQFKLTAPHVLQKQIGARIECVVVDAGTVVDSGQYVGFVPSPAMLALDDSSYWQQRAIVDKAREYSRTPGSFSSDSTIVGFGPEAVLVGGDQYKGEQPMPQAAPARQRNRRRTTR